VRESKKEREREREEVLGGEKNVTEKGIDG
jgi:hypothetical protein